MNAHATDFCDDKKAARQQLKQYRKEIDELADALAVEGKRSLLVILQARGELSTKRAQTRLRQIADMERTWAENGTVIRKFFLHISRKQQGSRFAARLDNPEKRWKVEESDFADRKLRLKFMRSLCLGHRRRMLPGTSFPLTISGIGTW